MEVHGSPRGSTLPKMNAEVSVRAQTNPCNIMGLLVLLCREKVLLGSVLKLSKGARDTRHYAKECAINPPLSVQSYTDGQKRDHETPRLCGSILKRKIPLHE